MDAHVDEAGEQTMFGSQYTTRHRSMLSAVAQGRAQVTCSRFPCLCVDGRWCDPEAAADLVRDGLVRATGTGTIDTLVPAALTSAGAALLATLGVGIQSGAAVAA